ncbi:hypothetical protein GCM10011383_22500 [Hymenobacter cavernae]|uniref:T9SS C-terminal target domain-containing protein n=2 Tax=Hymenobacter cavernae TaxID=2044852 RepID=A0ABQ1U7K4_9BACT|nr:hypothetical protein GCM10011383_22500 [Hymenobacter cavernae]
MSTAAQAQWVAQPIGFEDPEYTVVSGLKVIDNNVAWAATSNIDDTDGSLLPGYEYARTTDGGATWTTTEISALTIDEYSLGIFGVDANTAYVTVKDFTSGSSRIIKTTDGGTTWATSFTFSSQASIPVIVGFFNTNEGVCIGYPTTINGPFEIYTTSNAGVSWTRATNVPASLTPSSSSIEYVASVKPVVAGNSIWFVTGKNRIYYSSDKGKTWNVSAPTSTNPLQGLAFQDANNGLVIGLNAQNTSHTLLRTTDGGATWNNVSYTGPLHGYDISRVPGNGNYISVGVNIGSNTSNNKDAGSSYSQDNGQTWIPLESTRNHIIVDAASPTAIWTGAFGPGVYKLNTTVLSTRQDAVLQRSLHVFPNPSADGQFTVQLGSGLRSAAQVSVLDALGRSVYSQTVPAAANPNLAINLAQQAAGIYTLRVSSASGVAQQKLLLK